MTRRALAALAIAAAVVLLLAPAAGARNRFDTRIFARIGQPGYPADSLVGPDRTVYVGTFTNASGSDTGPSKVFAFAPSGKLKRTYVIKGQTPGSAHGVQVAAMDRNGVLYLLDQNPSRVLRLNPRTGKQTTYATFHDVLPCAPGVAPADCSATVMDNPPEPDYAAWGRDRSLYVTDYTQGLVWRVPVGGGAAHVWFTDPRLDGSLFGPAGIVMMPDRRTLMLSTSAGGATSPDATTGELYKLPILPNGRPGTLDEIWESGPKEAPDGFALAKSGNVYLALVGPDVNQLVVISPTGTELARFPGDTSGDNGTEIPFDEPSSVEFDGRRLLVTNNPYISGNADHFAVFDVYAGELGAPVYIPNRKHYRLKVKPRHAVAYSKHTFRFRARYGGRALRKRVLIRFAGHRFRTGKDGRAKLTVNVGKSQRLAKLVVGGRVVARARVFVAPHPDPAGR
jgi:sugar lactone lactonase YvrE